MLAGNTVKAIENKIAKYYNIIVDWTERRIHLRSKRQWTFSGDSAKLSAFNLPITTSSPIIQCSLSAFTGRFWPRSLPSDILSSSLSFDTIPSSCLAINPLGRPLGWPLTQTLAVPCCKSQSYFSCDMMRWASINSFSNIRGLFCNWGY